MKKSDMKVAKARTPAVRKVDEQPLLKALVGRAALQGDSLATLAKHLDVTYERLAQWRRNPEDMATVNVRVLFNAANYLGVPPILVFVMAKKIDLQHLVWPSAKSLESRVARQLEEMHQDSFLGGFVPLELKSAAPSVQLFVLFLHGQLQGQGGQRMRWMVALQEAVAGTSQVPTYLDEADESENFPVF